MSNEIFEEKHSSTMELDYIETTKHTLLGSDTRHLIERAKTLADGNLSLARVQHITVSSARKLKVADREDEIQIYDTSKHLEKMMDAVPVSRDLSNRELVAMLDDIESALKGEKKARDDINGRDIADPVCNDYTSNENLEQALEYVEKVKEELRAKGDRDE